MMNRVCVSVFLIGVLLLLAPQVSVAQSRDELEAIKQDVEELKKKQARLQKDLEAIKSAIRDRRQRTVFKPTVFDVGDDPFKGERNARLTLVDFSDYQ